MGLAGGDSEGGGEGDEVGSEAAESEAYFGEAELCGLGLGEHTHTRMGRGGWSWAVGSGSIGVGLTSKQMAEPTLPTAVWKGGRISMPRSTELITTPNPSAMAINQRGRGPQ